MSAQPELGKPLPVPEVRFLTSQAMVYVGRMVQMPTGTRQELGQAERRGLHPLSTNLV